MDAVNQASDIKENIDDKIQFNLVANDNFSDGNPLNSTSMVVPLTEDQSKTLGEYLWKIKLIAKFHERVEKFMISEPDLFEFAGYSFDKESAETKAGK
jgi:hypothetical protein